MMMIRAVYILMAIAVMLFIASFAWARMPVCLEEKGLVSMMWKKYQERPVLMAKMTRDDKWVTIYASPEHKTMTVMKVGKDGVVCVIFAAVNVSFLYPV